MIELVSEDPSRSKEGEMLKTTTKEIEFPVELEPSVTRADGL